MKYVVGSAVVFLLLFSVSFGQVPPPTEAMPSVEDMVKSLSGDQAEQASLADSIESIVESMTQQMQTKPVTEQTVRSAIEGTLVTEEAAPEVNLESVDAVDKKTLRYSPRIQLDFGEFPLRRISGKFSGAYREDGEVEEFEQTNISLTNGIVKRIQTRLKIETVRFEFKDRTAFLSGSVVNERQRDLIAAMLRMEPGIDQVKNEIIVEAK